MTLLRGAAPVVEVHHRLRSAAKIHHDEPHTREQLGQGWARPSGGDGSPDPIVETRNDGREEPFPLVSEEVEDLDARRKQGQSLETLAGPSRSH